MTPSRGWQRAVKRAGDMGISALLLVLLAPLLGVLALAVRWSLGSPVLFRQERPGRHGQPFVLTKFRTMTDARNAAGDLLPDAERLTPLGRWLRRRSLDELPELWLVLRGDMSLVGPRPLLMRYLARYTPRQMRRHAVRPGLTGWSQVNGRNATTWEQRLEMDTWYVEHWSLALDVRILWRSVGVVLGGRGISSEGHATMPEFWGTDEPS